MDYSIEVTISPDGKLNAKVQGIHGEGCDGLLDVLDQIGVVEDEGHTDDWDKKQKRQQGIKPRVSVR